MLFWIWGSGFAASHATEIRAMTPSDFLSEARILTACNSSWRVSEMDWDGFQARDLILLEYADGAFHWVSERESAEIERSRLDESPQFEVILNCTNQPEYILTGKDRGVKKRWETPPSLRELFATIDAMPMRQYEMLTLDN